MEQEEEPVSLTLVPIARFGSHLEATNEEQVATNSEAPTFVEKPINHISTFGNDTSVRVLEEVVEDLYSEEVKKHLKFLFVVSWRMKL